MAWYDLDEINQTKSEYLIKVKYRDIVCKVADNFKDIVNGELTDGVQYRLVTNKSFNAVTVIQYLLGYYIINELYIVVYRMNNRAFDFLKSIIDERQIKTGFIISTFFRENRNYERWAKELVILAKNKNHIKASFYNSHAKVFLAKTTCGKYIVFEGSGNLSHNERLEQYIFENNKMVYNFHKKWIDEILKI